MASDSIDTVDILVDLTTSNEQNYHTQRNSCTAHVLFYVPIIMPALTLRAKSAHVTQLAFVFASATLLPPILLLPSSSSSSSFYRRVPTFKARSHHPFLLERHITFGKIRNITFPIEKGPKVKIC